MAAGLLTSLVSASPAYAEANLFADAGIRLGYSWGEGGGFTWGIEARFGSVFGDEEALRCGYRFLPAVASALRFEAIGLAQPRLWLAGQTGAASGPVLFLADLGLG